MRRELRCLTPSTSSRTVLAAQKRIGLGSVPAPHRHRIPLQFLAHTVSHVAQVISFRKPAGVFKVAGCGFPGLAGVHPFGMMSNRIRNRLYRRLEPFELLLG